MNGFGPHLMMDGYGCDKKKLHDLNLIYRLLDELPTRIGMTKIMPPYVFKYSGLRPEDWGLPMRPVSSAQPRSPVAR